MMQVEHCMLGRQTGTVCALPHRPRQLYFLMLANVQPVQRSEPACRALGWCWAAISICPPSWPSAETAYSASSAAAEAYCSKNEVSPGTGLQRQAAWPTCQDDDAYPGVIPCICEAPRHLHHCGNTYNSDHVRRRPCIACKPVSHLRTWPLQASTWQL
jgi:hypothetical protein